MEEIYEVNEQEIERKMTMKERVLSALDTAKDFVDDHAEAIAYVIYLGGSAIIFGESIRYMHLLNRNAKKGIFPGYSR